LPLPVITAAQASVADSQLVITGTGFGNSRPTVTIPNSQLTVTTFSDKQIVAVLPAGLNGSYLITVTNNSSHLLGLFVVTVGTTGQAGQPGPSGPKGDKGDKGDAGAPGAVSLVFR